MTRELEAKLIKKYPKILVDIYGDPRQTCMAFGAECGDGWYDLLDDCMNKIQYLCDLWSTNGKEVQVVANQVKEKFGTLRFYISLHGANEIENNIIDDIISEAERKSEHTCEVTGEHGEPCKKGGWRRTLSYQQARKDGYIACNESTEKYWKEKDEKETAKTVS